MELHAEADLHRNSICNVDEVTQLHDLKDSPRRRVLLEIVIFETARAVVTHLVCLQLNVLCEDGFLESCTLLVGDILGDQLDVVVLQHAREVHCLVRGIHFLVNDVCISGLVTVRDVVLE